MTESSQTLSTQQAERFQRQLSLAGFGPSAQRRLLDSRVLVIGAGGLGSPVLSYLAAAGVGTIDIVDHDTVERSNLHRQVIHSEERIGAPKTASAAQVMRGLHPDIVIHEHREPLTAENALVLMAPAEVIVDGSDNFATRYIVADAAEIAGKPVVHGAILRFNGQLGVFWAGRGPVYRDLYPSPPPPEAIPSCAEAGVLGVLPGVIGTLMAAETIKLLTGLGEPLIGRVLGYDALTAEFHEIPLKANPDRVPADTIGADVAPPAGAGTGEAGAPGTDAAGDTGATDDTAGTIDGATLRELLHEGRAPVLVDVREEWEYQLGAIPGAVNVPLAGILDGSTQVPGVSGGSGTSSGPGPEVVLYCKAGARSRRAREALRRAGAAGVILSLSGGYDAWTALREEQDRNDRA
ncbi:molybdopterin-synthase adenylyltransferase MoeB [Sediminivirga luteola]|uniref:molybdopterin-synthase adenylyltransferase MoeB n=1 Tax=Sediminivirga luteola TaxID=1774748 RepID=UPI001F575EC2|nr:molybdopterin-synthase adenylyltransferase MoeB [Sediminivirga luteola]MCI2263951.1 molybdopterin-synthase adenylyltransferase MoeB [Sediminivirga luteola]